MTLQLPPPPALPPLPSLPARDDEGGGFGAHYMDIHRMRQQILADHRVQLAHARAIAALERDARLYEALAVRDRSIRAQDALDAPTMDIPVVPTERAETTDQAADDEPRGRRESSEPLTALERAKRYYWSCLDAGENPSADDVALHPSVDCSRGYIKRGKHLDPWHAEWKSNR